MKPSDPTQERAPIEALFARSEDLSAPLADRASVLLEALTALADWRHRWPLAALLECLDQLAHQHADLERRLRAGVLHELDRQAAPDWPTPVSALPPDARRAILTDRLADGLRTSDAVRQALAHLADRLAGLRAQAHSATPGELTRLAARIPDLEHQLEDLLRHPYERPSDSPSRPAFFRR